MVSGESKPGGGGCLSCVCARVVADVQGWMMTRFAVAMVACYLLCELAHAHVEVSKEKRVKVVLSTQFDAFLCAAGGWPSPLVVYVRARPEHVQSPE